MRVAVVILNYNGVGHLETYLPSVLEHSPKGSVIVADNGSTDHSIAWLKENYPQVELIALPENYGFAEGYNQALNRVEAEYYVLLNSDVEVTNGWIDPILDLMDRDPKVAAAQPKLLWWTHKDQFEYAGAAGGFIDKYGFPFCRGRMFQTQEHDKGQYNEQSEIFWATGACLFIRAKLYHEAGGLDGYYFAHMEEIDLCWRLKRMGYKNMYVPQSVAYHLGGGTLSNVNPRKTFLNFRNNLITLYKHLPRRSLLTILLPKLILDGLAGVKFLLEGGFGHFVAVVKAHFAFYGQLGRYSKVKRELKAKYGDAPVTEVYMGSVVKDYFLSGKKAFSALDQKLFRKSTDK